MPQPHSFTIRRRISAGWDPQLAATTATNWTKRHVVAGQKYGRLTTIEQVDSRRWRCRCSCGQDCVIQACNFLIGKAKSCGCFRREFLSTVKATHGQSRLGKMTQEYRCWRSMRDRCYRQSSKAYPDYGGRGITVCERWLESFEHFFADMGTKPTPQHTLDRVDNDGPYAPGNCRWATRLDQRLNQRPRQYRAAR